MIFGWSNFYFLIGSAAAGLIGLTFVVVTLTAGRERAASLRGAGLYLTPTVVHFVTVFAISAVTMVPGLHGRWTAIAIALIAGFGLGCAVRSAFGISGPNGATGLTSGYTAAFRWRSTPPSWPVRMACGSELRGRTWPWGVCCSA
jgi:hypothetical protein